MAQAVRKDLMGRYPLQPHFWPTLKEKADFLLSVDAGVNDKPAKAPDFLIREYFDRRKALKPSNYEPLTLKMDKDLKAMIALLSVTPNPRHIFVWTLYTKGYKQLPACPKNLEKEQRWILCALKQESETPAKYGLAPVNLKLFLPIMRQTSFMRRRDPSHPPPASYDVGTLIAYTGNTINWDRPVKEINVTWGRISSSPSPEYPEMYTIELLNKKIILCPLAALHELVIMPTPNWPTIEPNRTPPT
jgi:hypothetical protein